MIEKGIELIDSFHTSTTEEIEAKTKSKVDLMKAYAPFKVAQRYLALLFSFTYLLSYISVVIAAIWKEEMVGKILEIMGVFNLNFIMGTIILFYFGCGAAEGVIRQIKTNKEVKDGR